MTIKRSREEITEIESLAIANSLILLSRVGDTSNSGRVYECKTCHRKFNSFQALGGHRASHTKPKLMPLLDHFNYDVVHDDGTPVSKPKAHECSICGREFPMGQALGGHMRRHRGVAVGGFAAEEDVPVRKKLDTKGNLWLDLNLTPYENDLHFRFRKGFQY